MKKFFSLVLLLSNLYSVNAFEYGNINNIVYAYKDFNFSYKNLKIHNRNRIAHNINNPIKNYSSYSSIDFKVKLNFNNYFTSYDLKDFLRTKTFKLGYENNDIKLSLGISNNDFFNNIELNFKDINIRIYKDKLNIGYNMSLNDNKAKIKDYEFNENHYIDYLFNFYNEKSRFNPNRLDNYNFNTDYFLNPNDFKLNGGNCRDMTHFNNTYLYNKMKSYYVIADSTLKNRHMFSLAKDQNYYIIDFNTIKKSNMNMENTLKSHWNATIYSIYNRDFKLIKTIYSDEYKKLLDHIKFNEK